MWNMGYDNFENSKKIVKMCMLNKNLVFSLRKANIVCNKAKKQISERMLQENKTQQISKQTFLTPWYAYVRVRIPGKECSFFSKFDVLCFLVTPVLRFALLPYYLWYIVHWRTKPPESIACKLKIGKFPIQIN